MKKAIIESEHDEPVVLKLTASEIFNTCGVGFERGFTLYDSYVVEYEDKEMPWGYSVENDRTGYSCCIGVIEKNLGRKIALEYVVELQIAMVFFVFTWYSDDSPAKAEYVKKCAHQTFIKACALIGVNVGYHLVTDPSPY